jgi:sirohydrochlorin cobaltochelatase
MNSSSIPLPVNSAIVLFAHGSRDPLWHLPIQAVANQIKQNNPQAQVACAYLELSSPDLDTACKKLIENGVNTISIIPLFFGVGRHAREDLPLLVKTLRDNYPTIHFVLQPAVGENPRLIQFLAILAEESLQTSAP